MRHVDLDHYCALTRTPDDDLRLLAGMTWLTIRRTVWLRDAGGLCPSHQMPFLSHDQLFSVLRVPLVFCTRSVSPPALAVSKAEAFLVLVRLPHMMGDIATGSEPWSGSPDQVQAGERRQPSLLSARMFGQLSILKLLPFISVEAATNLQMAERLVNLVFWAFLGVSSSTTC